jgi:hypothetical protein
MSTGHGTYFPRWHRPSLDLNLLLLLLLPEQWSHYHIGTAERTRTRTTLVYNTQHTTCNLWSVICRSSSNTLQNNFVADFSKGGYHKLLPGQTFTTSQKTTLGLNLRVWVIRIQTTEQAIIIQRSKSSSGREPPMGLQTPTVQRDESKVFQELENRNDTCASTYGDDDSNGKCWRLDDNYSPILIHWLELISYVARFRFSYLEIRSYLGNRLYDDHIT